MAVQKKAQKNANTTRQKPLDFILCIIIFLLLALGIVMVLSASAPSSLSTYGNSYHYVIRQGIFAIVGIAVMFFVSKLDFRIYKHFYKIAYWVGIAALLLVVIPKIGVEINGAKRWADLGFGTFQPSEITKICLIIFYAGYLTEHRNELGYFWKGFVKAYVPLILPIAILYKVQNHLSASIVIILITSIMMIMAGAKLRYYVGSGIIGGVAGALGLTMLIAKGGSDNFRVKRILSFMDPWQDATDTGWQVIQGLYAIGSGGLFGVGLGQSKQKYLYIPEPHNDFIFAIIAEELGFVGCLIVIALFAAFIWRGLVIAMKAQDSFGSLLAVGITSLVGIQSIINIAVVTSSMPNTGMSLPFISYGGTALLILLFSMGILLNISRTGSKV